MKAHALLFLSLLVAACDKDKPRDPSPSTSASAPVVATAASATPSATAPASVSATAAASDTAPVDLANVMITIKDATAEPQKSVKAKLGGAVTLFLPDAAGSTWAVDVADKALGKPKEETMPGFGPGTNAHQFQFSTKGAALKVGETHKVTFVAKKGGKPNGTFTLSIEIVG